MQSSDNNKTQSTANRVVIKLDSKRATDDGTMKRMTTI